MKIAFITGSSRSGTSILGELIASHPQVSYVFEEAVWAKLKDKKFNSHVVQPNEIDTRKINKLRSWMACYIKGDNIVVEKNPRHIVRLPLLKKIFPGAKIIHIVRDGRDVACSLKSGLCGKTWAHVKPYNWKEIENKYDGVIRCAWAWRYTMEIAIKDLATIPHLQIKYEDLLNNPEQIIKEILKYLDLPSHDKMLNFCKNINNNNDDGTYKAKNQTRWETNDHDIRVGRWKENMTDVEQVEVEKILRPILNHFKYK